VSLFCRPWDFLKKTALTIPLQSQGDLHGAREVAALKSFFPSLRKTVPAAVAIVPNGFVVFEHLICHFQTFVSEFEL
jgi:hypothetical protein